MPRQRSLTCASFACTSRPGDVGDSANILHHAQSFPRCQTFSTRLLQHEHVWIKPDLDRAMADESIHIDDGKASNGEAHLDDSNLANGRSEHKSPESFGQKVKRIALANLLVILTVAAVVIGVFIGLGVRNAGLTQTQIIYFGFPGELLIRLLKMIIIPLVVCSLVSGAASIDPKALGKLGGWAMLFFLVTTLFASAIGVIMAFIIQPGASSDGNTLSRLNTDDSNVPEAKEVIDSFLDLIR